MSQAFDGKFSNPRSVTISPAALTMAREFAVAIGQMGYARQVVVFDWAPWVIVREPGQLERNIGACLMIGAQRRDEVPPEAVEMVDGFALTLVIPDEAWPPGALRLIDVDEEQWFRLGLR
ncbi:MAG: hypothetical protein QOD09_3121 [Bradyrhizobium sp.]|jgi:hypothetical protein|nr:hypothetical protein [Bradyrhizobium sp.]